MCGWFHSRGRACIALALLVLFGAGNSAAQVSVAPPAAVTIRPPPPDISAKDYFATTPQLADPLHPLASLSSGRASVRAIVATVPDPAETHLGRSFDMALSATISAYQSQGYVLDGYAFPWRPLAPLKPGARDESASDETRTYRKTPGVLRFRRDLWRAESRSAVPNYALVFLVGESPSYGVQRGAFDVAARCAINLNTFGPTQVATLRIRERCDATPDVARAVMLDVLGPSFSGSMQSLALAIQALRNGSDFARIDVLLLSASATVSSNRSINNLSTIDPGQPHAQGDTTYVPIAWPIKDQYKALRSYLCSLPVRAHERKVVILAEESSFGRDAEQFSELTPPCSDDQSSGAFRVSVRSFPPNIASIRAEHSIQRDAEESRVPGMSNARGRLLELDMTSAREGMDRPTVYEPGLTSRSDELLLFSMFDTLRLRVRPDVVVIVATDVRDRLFLLSHVRQGLPDALPVMMELDYLAIHPDYRRGSRGAVVVPAGDAIVCTDKLARLTACKRLRKGGWPRTYSFATDYAANVFRATSLLLRWHERRREDQQGILWLCRAGVVVDVAQRPLPVCRDPGGLPGTGFSARGWNDVVVSQPASRWRIPS